jgi:hypothetical protein
MICHCSWASLHSLPAGLGRPPLYATITPAGRLGDAVCVGWTATKIMSPHRLALLTFQPADLGRPPLYVTITPAGRLGDAVCVGWTATYVTWAHIQKSSNYITKPSRISTCCTPFSLKTFHTLSCKLSPHESLLFSICLMSILDTLS